MLNHILGLGEEGERDMSDNSSEQLVDTLAAILDTAIDPLVSVDTSGTIVLFNQAAARVFGYQPAEVIGRPLAMLLPDRFAVDHDRHLHNFAERGGSNRSMGELGSVMGRRRDGEEFPAEASISRVETDRGLILTAAIRDLTDQDEEERRYRTLFDNAIAGIIHIDPDGKLLAVNPEMARMLGYDSPDHVTSEVQHLQRLVADTDADRRLKHTLALAAIRGFEVEEDLLRQDGSTLTVLATGRVLRGAHGRPTGVLFVAVDITERRRIESELRHSEARLQRTQALAHVGSLEWEVESGVAHWSTEVYRILCYEPGAVTPSRSTFLRHIVSEDRRRVEDALRSARVSGSYDLEYAVHTSGGDRRILHERGELLTDDDGRPLRAMAAIHDVTERHRAERILEEQATHDPLTGLPNRVLLFDRIHHAVGRRSSPGTKSAVLFCDLDRFKVINDSLGHSAGDQLLIEAAERISSVVRVGDTVARFGGDEFVVLQEEIAEPADADLLAARLVEVLSAPYSYQGRSLHLGVSVGIAIADQGADAEALIRDADTAMYHAKASGRGQSSRFTTSLREQASERLEVEEDLRQAIDDEQLFIELQPIVDLDSSCWTGLEVLVRWMHPLRGRLEPASFIAVAEETGLIRGVGDWVIAEACSQLATLDQRGLGGLDLAINLSPVQLAATGLVDRIESSARSHGLDPVRICFEVTETALLHDGPIARRVLGELRELGSRIALDDFGTGSASLSHLRRFPVTDLKIDRSFVAGLPTGDDTTIIQTVLAMGQTLGMEVVAEGVERPDQLQALMSYGCRFAQGFHLGRPLPLPEVVAELERRTLDLEMPPAICRDR